MVCKTTAFETDQESTTAANTSVSGLESSDPIVSRPGGSVADLLEQVRHPALIIDKRRGLTRVVTRRRPTDLFGDPRGSQIDGMYSTRGPLSF
ncbi:MAG: hypothetical protein AAGF44_07105 [Pseudomonadota bacterium]